MNIFVIGDEPMVEAFEMIGVPGRVPAPDQDIGAYAEGRRVRDLATVVGEADLSEPDKLYLKFGGAFEEQFIAQGSNEERSIIDSLDLSWSLLQLLPADELTRVSEEQIREHYS